MLFSDDLSSIPDSGTQHGYEVMSELSTERLQHAPFASVLSSAERKHYNRALQELCRIVKLGSHKLDAAEQVSYGSRPRHSREARRNYGKDAGDDVASLSDPDVTLQLPTSQRSNGRHDDIDDEDGDIDDDDDDDVVDIDESNGHYIKSKHRPRRKTKRRVNTRGDEDHGLNTSVTSDQSHALQTVYAELATISKKLQRQSVALQERELAVQERERIIEGREEVLGDDTSIHLAHKEFNRRWHRLQEEHDKQVKELEHIIKDRGKEIKRQRESFDTLKQANEGLRNQLDKVQEQNKKMESQAISLQHRLTNLQRHQELTSRQRDHQSVSAKAKLESVQKFGHQVSTSSEPAQKMAPPVRHTKHSTSLYDTLGILLEWVSDVHLRHYSSDPSKPLESLPSPALTCDRCIRVLPSLVDVLGQLPSQAAKLHLPCLQFIYWALLHLDSSDNQHVSLSSTYRRLGEELYRPTVVRFAGDQDKSSPEVQSMEKPKSAIFFKSANLHVRFLSSLIILKTISQIDYLANVFDVIRCDLKDERSKELYLRYQATPVILAYMKASNKGVMASAVDVFLQMSMESIFMQQYLYSCSTEPWLRSCAALLSTPNLDVKIWEKLSIILQKLSKLKSNKHLFDTTGVSAVIQEMARTGACQENAFLALNLRSILFNLNLVKMNPTSVR